MKIIRCDQGDKSHKVANLIVIDGVDSLLLVIMTPQQEQQQ
jgi:hypothetical protein